MLVASALLVIGTSAFAGHMKCGAGKCGDSMKEKPAKKCGGMKKAEKKKCGAGKCGDAKKEKKKAMKCGTGKCGSK